VTKFIKKLGQRAEGQAGGCTIQLESSLIELPASVVARRLAEEDAKILNLKPASALDVYSQGIVKAGDCIIREQPLMKLPLSLACLLTMNLRDEGNGLIEATRALNNRYAGCWTQAVKVQLFADVELMDLKARVLNWCERAMQEVLYKRRRGVENEPFVTYGKLFETFIREIDTRIAHGDDRMYQEIWSRAMDCMCYQLIEGCFLKPGHIVCRHGIDAFHLLKWEGACLRNKHVANCVSHHMNLYGVDAALYTRDVVLRPLSAALVDVEAMDPDVVLRADFHSCVGDLLEAFPYLCSSKRTSRYTFPIRGSTCVAVFRFLGPHGFGMFAFFDSEEELHAGLETGACRAGLTLDFDGALGCLMHPWLTVERFLGATDALRVSHWLISQVHGRIVEDYLKINRYFLQRKQHDGVPDSGSGVANGANDLLVHAEYAEALREPIDADPHFEAGASIPAVAVNAGRGPFLPQIRRSRFFKILRMCGVEIVQGKGSEIKLLRGGAHPFRLGSHYGVNPAIPSFLAGQILKRLEISREEWISAISASRI